jgi:hypothetical protein
MTTTTSSASYTVATRIHPAQRSTTSLVTKQHDKRSRDGPPQRRNRTQSFNSHNQNVAVTNRPSSSLSWPQVSRVRDIEPRSPRASIPRQILFYDRHRPHYGFTNFSAHPVTYKGKIYPTSEHLFQSFKVSPSVYPIPNYEKN